MTKYELKPCPFCDGKAKESVRFVKCNLKTIKIICVECGCGTAVSQQYPFQPWQAVKKEAIEAWNRRADDAADVKPVRHGHWKNISESDMSKTVMCSVCNKMFYFTKKGQLNIDMVPYCPNCGAKMDEVEE